MQNPKLLVPNMNRHDVHAGFNFLLLSFFSSQFYSSVIKITEMGRFEPYAKLSTILYLQNPFIF